VSAQPHTPPASASGRRALTLIALIAAGEAAFFLPFLLARVFRPTVLEVFAITNLELGTAYGVYGSVAMFAYIGGGPLADRFGARNLLTIALLTTAAGGALLMTVPTLSTLILLYAYWGVTTIALFWAPLIKATRDWGGVTEQGVAFGLLDGGRGLLAAIVASLMVALFAWLLPADAATASFAELSAALRQIIVLLFAMTVCMALVLWLLLPATKPTSQPDSTQPSRLNLQGLRHVLRIPTVWLQAIIILCAYVGFKSVDDFSLYANQVLGVDQVEAAGLGTLSLWVRPVAAVAAGFAADRFGAGRMTILSFAAMTLGGAVLASGIITQGVYALFLFTVVGTSLGIYALRGLYFAIMQEGRVPLAITGSAVGLVSLIGYTPDVFMGPLMGYLLDRSPGAIGHQHVFMVLTGFAIVGLATSIVFHRMTQNASGHAEPTKL
jgi:nitrate/nitrite transporter NarK